MASIAQSGAASEAAVLMAAQVLEMRSLGSAWIEQVYAASWALKDTQGGIPADYANDGYWP